MPSGAQRARTSEAQSPEHFIEHRSRSDNGHSALSRFSFFVVRAFGSVYALLIGAIEGENHSLSNITVSLTGV